MLFRDVAPGTWFLSWRRDKPVFGLSITDKAMSGAIVFGDDAPNGKKPWIQTGGLSNETVLALPAVVIRPTLEKSRPWHDHQFGVLVLNGGGAYVRAFDNFGHGFWINVETGLLSELDHGLPSISFEVWRVGFETPQGFEPIFTFSTSHGGP